MGAGYCVPALSRRAASADRSIESVRLMASEILLVEDSRFLRRASERSLTRAGFEVSTAADGEEALRLAEKNMPDIILLDLMLPKLSGQEVLRKLKANPATAAIPVIVLTSLSQRNEDKLLQEGAEAYFEKAALKLDKNPDRLASAVAQILQRRATRR
jgi:CheY-like chemotaxis protein